jgi:hypothetical protein
MRRMLSTRIAKLEGKGEDAIHVHRATSDEEARAIQEQWNAGPLSKVPGHKLLIILRRIYDAPPSY